MPKSLNEVKVSFYCIHSSVLSLESQGKERNKQFYISFLVI